MDLTSPWTVTYIPAVATVEDRLADRVSRPAETVVEHLSGWRIRHTSGARLADIHAPDGQAVDAVEVVAWDWAPPEGGSSRAAGPDPTSVELSEALAEWVAGHASGLDLPGL